MEGSSSQRAEARGRMSDLHMARLKRAMEARRRSIEEFGWALRARKSTVVVDELARACRETDAELTAAMAEVRRGRSRH